MVSAASKAVTLNGAAISVNNEAFFALPLAPGTAVYNIQASNPTGTVIKR